MICVYCSDEHPQDYICPQMPEHIAMRIRADEAYWTPEVRKQALDATYKPVCSICGHGDPYPWGPSCGGTHSDDYEKAIEEQRDMRKEPISHMEAAKERDEILAREASPGFQSRRLLERLCADGGRYLLSIGLSKDEINDGQTPTYGGKSSSRWLTDEEYRALVSALHLLENA